MHSSTKNTVRKNGGAAGPAQPLGGAAGAAQASYRAAFGLEEPSGKRAAARVVPRKLLGLFWAVCRKEIRSSADFRALEVKGLKSAQNPIAISPSP